MVPRWFLIFFIFSAITTSSLHVLYLNGAVLGGSGPLGGSELEPMLREKRQERRLLDTLNTRSPE